MRDLTTPRPWGVCELPWDDRGTAIYSPPGDPHGARLVASTDTEWLADSDDDAGVDQANADLIVRAVNAHDELVELLVSAQIVVCSATCPNVWLTGNPQPHTDLCIRATTALKKAEEVKS